MARNRESIPFSPWLFIAAMLFISCMAEGMPWNGPAVSQTHTAPPLTMDASPTAETDPSSAAAGGKWPLWTNGTRLRGANIYQRRVFPEMDGTEFYGPGPFGPPYSQEDIDRLAALGANYVNVSTAGLFTVQPPYEVDEEAVAGLDRLLDMIAKADMFAVITFRSGPGRSEFSLIGDEEWTPPEYIINTVWTDEAARKAWARMWRFAAQRYREFPGVIGYDLMCEPNANEAVGIWDPGTFSARYAGTGYDWNSWYPDIVSAIRKVDPFTPILVGGNAYSSVEWLPYLRPVDAPFIVYAFHQYSPYEYTNSSAPEEARSYPGKLIAGEDGDPDRFNRAWLENLLSLAVQFSEKYDVPLAVNEFGVVRWASGAAEYVRDEIELFEAYGWNYAVWQWQSAWLPLAEGDNSFNFRFGPAPDNLADVDNELFSSYIAAWGRNTIRPSGL